MTIIVCPLSHVGAVVRARRPSHLITLLNPEDLGLVETPESIAAERHLRLGVSDIADPIEGLTAPQEAHVLTALEFARGWGETSPLLVHCWAGISRSTATAFVLACDRNPEASETAIARALREAAPHACPNRRIVRLADDILGRGGRMADAIERIGGDVFLAEGRPFDLPARF